MVACIVSAVIIAGCAEEKPLNPYPPARTDSSEPTAKIRAEMSKLSVKHHYDATSGQIVADEVVALPAVLREAPALGDAIDRGRELGKMVIAFVTADRCAVCQQFKQDVLNDPRVVSMLESGQFIVTHAEVERDYAAINERLALNEVPASYALGERRVATLSGYCSADELVRWLEAR